MKMLHFMNEFRFRPYVHHGQRYRGSKSETNFDDFATNFGDMTSVLRSIFALRISYILSILARTIDLRKSQRKVSNSAKSHGNGGKPTGLFSAIFGQKSKRTHKLFVRLLLWHMIIGWFEPHLTSVNWTLFVFEKTTQDELKMTSSPVVIENSAKNSDSL